MGYTILTGIWEEVDQEIARAQTLHAERSFLTRDTYSAIAPLTEELGEVAQAATKWHDEGAPIADVRKELIQLAASAIAMIVRIDTDALAESAGQTPRYQVEQISGDGVVTHFVIKDVVTGATRGGPYLDEARAKAYAYSYNQNA